MNTYQQNILNYLDNTIDEIGQTFSDLVKIPTTNPYSRDADPAGEAKGQAYILAHMKEAGAKVTSCPVPKDVYTQGGILGPSSRNWTHRESIIGRFRFGDGTGPTFVLNGHMDTVGVDDYEGNAFSGEHVGGVVHGRGTSDCKCGIVAALYAIKALQNSGAPLNCHIIFESVVDEECNGSGAGTLSCCLANIRGDYCLVMDGASDTIYPGCQGILTAEITVEGRAGHGSAGGVSAVEKLLVAKQAIDNLGRERAKTAPDYPINVGVIRAGQAPWTVPNHGWLAANINYSYAEAQKAEKAGKGFCGIEIRQQLQEILASICGNDEWLKTHPAKLEWIKDLPPFTMADAGKTEKSKALLSTAQKSYESVWDSPPKTEDLHAWGDASHAARIGKMPTIGMGAGEPGTSHTATEHNKVSNVRNTAATAALTILALAGH